MPNLVDWYHQQTANGTLNFDDAQLTLLKELSEFLNNFARQNFITRLWRKDHKLGYYIYGDVGRGKTMIMNAMYQHTSTLRKTRRHFHEFMREVHSQLATNQENSDPVDNIARQLKAAYDIIYLDEMHVSDIATAMIMKRLLEAMFAKNIYIVTSSNYHPDGLWPNGLMRERFLPAIAVLKDRLQIASLNSQQDYRLINNSVNQLFIINQANSTQQLQQIFSQLTGKPIANKPQMISICQRKLVCREHSNQVIWFDFNVICGPMRSQLDYLELVRSFDWFIISDIYQLGQAEKDIARRLTWLIDILYDNGSKLVLSSTVPIKDIYHQGDFANEFNRTVSRLEEMQTEEYLQKKLTVNLPKAYNNALENRKQMVNGA